MYENVVADVSLERMAATVVPHGTVVPMAAGPLVELAVVFVNLQLLDVVVVPLSAIVPLVPEPLVEIAADVVAA